MRLAKAPSHPSGGGGVDSPGNYRFGRHVEFGGKALTTQHILTDFTPHESSPDPSIGTHLKRGSRLARATLRLLGPVAPWHRRSRGRPLGRVWRGIPRRDATTVCSSLPRARFKQAGGCAVEWHLRVQASPGTRRGRLSPPDSDPWTRMGALFRACGQRSIRFPRSEGSMPSGPD